MKDYTVLSHLLLSKLELIEAQKCYNKLFGRNALTIRDIMIKVEHAIDDVQKQIDKEIT